MKLDPLSLDRRHFISGAMALGASTLAASLQGQTPMPAVLGPILGHAEPTLAMVWMRLAAEGDYTLELVPAKGGPARTYPQKANQEHDLCIHWRADGLQPGTAYGYRILHGGKEIAEDPAQVITTPLPLDRPAKLRFAISSCALEDAGSRAVWQQMAKEQVDAVVLIGDTPYVDSTALEKQTKRYQEFAAVPEYQALLRSRACWWTWDDHDFAGNDCNGRSKGKENSRLVFTRYRSMPSYGNGQEGIYTSFRRGPVEVFLLDTRWFSNTGPSFADPAKLTLLGEAQWEWLQKSLLASTAPFKLLTCGIIWDNKQNKESDDWGHFLHELAAVKNFIAQHRIPGVVLMGGDIHASRVLRYKTTKEIGYDLVQMIASPIHGRTIPSLNVYNPDLVRSAVEPHVFLRVDVDSTVTPAELHATLINKKGEQVFSYHLTENDLKPKA